MSLRNKIRKMIIEIEIEKPSISYSAVVLDETSRKKLLILVKNMVPEKWEIIAHHMTICLGELSEDLKPYIGHSARLFVTGLGMNSKAFAARVEGFDSEKPIPHITIAINILGGGNPKDSNDIENWSDFNGNLTLMGKIEEIPFVKKEQIDENFN